MNSVSHSQFLKMQIVPNAKASTLLTLQRTLSAWAHDLQQCIQFLQCSSEGYCCDIHKYDPKSGRRQLKWLRVMISNIKANI